MDAQTLINVLTWGIVTVGTGLVFSVVWFARRIVAQLDRLEELFTKTTTDLDKRVYRLEDWRTMVSSQLDRGPKGTI